MKNFLHRLVQGFGSTEGWVRYVRPVPVPAKRISTGVPGMLPPAIRGVSIAAWDDALRMSAMTTRLREIRGAVTLPNFASCCVDAA